MPSLSNSADKGRAASATNPDSVKSNEHQGFAFTDWTNAVPGRGSFTPKGGISERFPSIRIGRRLRVRSWIIRSPRRTGSRTPLQMETNNARACSDRTCLGHERRPEMSRPCPQTAPEAPRRRCSPPSIETGKASRASSAPPASVSLNVWNRRNRWSERNRLRTTTPYRGDAGREGDPEVPVRDVPLIQIRWLPGSPTKPANRRDDPSYASQAGISPLLTREYAR